MTIARSADGDALVTEGVIRVVAILSGDDIPAIEAVGDNSDDIASRLEERNVSRTRACNLGVDTVE